MRSPVLRGGIRTDKFQQIFNQRRGSVQPRNLANHFVAAAMPVPPPPSRPLMLERLQLRRLSVHANAGVLNHAPEMISLSEPMVFDSARAHYSVKLMEPDRLPIPSEIHENKIRFAKNPANSRQTINRATRKAYDDFQATAARCFSVRMLCFLFPLFITCSSCIVGMSTLPLSSFHLLRSVIFAVLKKGCELMNFLRPINSLLAGMPI